MREFQKSKVILYINIIITSFLVSMGIICLALMNKTTVFIGVDLYIIFGIAFFLFSIPFCTNIINYLLLPQVVMTINKEDIIIHKRNKDVRIFSRKLLGVTKSNSFNFIYGLDAGTLKLLVADEDKPYYIKNVDELDNVYQILNIIILDKFNQKRSALK